MEYTSVERPPTIRPGVLAAATAVCGLLGVLVWHSSGAAAWERPLISVLQHEQLPLGRAFVLLCEPIPFAIVTLWLAWTVLSSNRVLLALSGTVGCVVAVTTTAEILKPLVGRHHPYPGAAIFPSTHVTAAAAWAMFAWLAVKPTSRFRSALVLVPVAVAWSSISTGGHYPADTIAGLFVGGVVVYGVVSCTQYVLRDSGDRFRPQRAWTVTRIDGEVTYVRYPIRTRSRVLEAAQGR